MGNNYTINLLHSIQFTCLRLFIGVHIVYGLPCNVRAAEILTPSNVHVPPLVIDNKDGTVTIKYQPTEKGMHELHVRYKERPIPGAHRTPMLLLMRIA